MIAHRWLNTINIKKAHIDSLNLMSESFEDLFKSDDYFIETIKARGVFSPARYKAEFGQKLKRNLSEVKVVHSLSGISVPLKRLAKNNQMQIIEFAGLSGYLEKSILLQKLFKSVSVEMKDSLISRIDICLDYSRIPSIATKNLNANRIAFKYKGKGTTIYFKSKCEAKNNPYYDVKIYNHSLKNGLAANIQRIEFCFKKSFIGDVMLKDIESIYPKIEKAILKASGLSVKIVMFL